MSVTKNLMELAKDNLTDSGACVAHVIAESIDVEFSKEVDRYLMAEARWSKLADHYRSCYVELPLDSDGEYIRFGDWVTDGKDSGRVHGIHAYEDGDYRITTDNDAVDMRPSKLLHVKEDQLKELLRDCVMKSMGVNGVLDGVPVLEVTDIFDEWYEEFADKVREAAKDD